MLHFEQDNCQGPNIGCGVDKVDSESFRCCVNRDTSTRVSVAQVARQATICEVETPTHVILQYIFGLNVRMNKIELRLDEQNCFNIGGAFQSIAWYISYQDLNLSSGRPNHAGSEKSRDCGCAAPKVMKRRTQNLVGLRADKKRGNVKNDAFAPHCVGINFQHELSEVFTRVLDFRLRTKAAHRVT